MVVEPTIQLLPPIAAENLRLKQGLSDYKLNYNNLKAWAGSAKARIERLKNDRPERLEPFAPVYRMVLSFNLESAMRLSFALVGLMLLGLTACATPPNLKSASDYDAPAAPPVKHPLYDPYAPYGQANATWRPPVFNRAGTIVRPVDPSVDQGRPDYEHADWATGAAGGSALAPPGTF